MYLSKTRQYKESIVDSFYNCNLGGPVIVTTLAGPDFDRIAVLAEDSLNPIEINSYETNEGIYNSQVAQLSFLDEELRSKTNLYHQNVNRCIVSNFMDIDLMGTVLSQQGIVKELLNQQKYLKGDKCFIATFSVRMVGITSTLRAIRNMLGLALKSKVEVYSTYLVKEHDGKLVYKNKFEVSFNKRVKQLDVYSYSDNVGPMMTFRVIYK